LLARLELLLELSEPSFPRFHEPCHLRQHEASQPTSEGFARDITALQDCSSVWLVGGAPDKAVPALSRVLAARYSVPPHTRAHPSAQPCSSALFARGGLLVSSQRVHVHWTGGRRGSRLHHGAAWHRQLILRYAARYVFVFFYRLRRAAAPTAWPPCGRAWCPGGAKADKKKVHVSATPNRPRPGNLAHFWPRPGNLVLQVIWSTFCQNVAEVICPSLLIYQVFWPSNSGPPGILALHFEKPGILAGCKTRAQVICPAVFGKPGNLPRIFWKTR